MDFQGAGAFPLMLVRDYNSQDAVVREFGGGWRGQYTRFIGNVSASEVAAVRDDGRQINFKLSGTAWVAESNVNSRLTRTATGWIYTSGIDETETYNNAGRLIAVKNLAGLSQTMTYDASGNLATVSDPFGRLLRFSYKPRVGVAGFLISQVIVPDGGIYAYGYSANNQLISVTYPDGSRRQFLYELPSERFALTGIVDEKGNRFATFGYKRETNALSGQTVLTAILTDMPVARCATR